ncbi:hypothetical protein [Bradyrhizobium acaciae]|uniref:hypothetical protein n=1 Tax=Bradyrhizobium acaciae TaxID=2683706 RepID=UPI00308460EA|nr:hypothetical protein [Bradyrhizobium acaciae]
MAAVEAVKGAVRGEEAEAAGIADNDAGGAIRYFDDVSLRRLDLGDLCVGHACSIAERRRSCLIVGCFDFLSDQQQTPVAAETQRCCMRLRMSHVRLRWGCLIAVTLNDADIAYQYPAEPRRGQ